MTTKKTDKNTTETTLGKANGLVAQVSEAGKAFVTGTIEVDKMILGQIAEGAKSTAEHGRSLFGAKDIKTAADMHIGFLQNSVEKSFANTRDVLDFTQSRLQAVLSPFSKAS